MIKKIAKHIWISHNGKTKDYSAKCCKCGLIRDSISGKRLYFQKGKKLQLSPKCI